LVAVPIAASVVGMVGGSLALIAVAVIANWALATADDKRVQSAGYLGQPALAWLLIPAYLFVRSRHTGNWAITLAWVFAFIVSLAVPTAR
jgi:hypothetical protein